MADWKTLLPAGCSLQIALESKSASQPQFLVVELQGVARKELSAIGSTETFKSNTRGRELRLEPRSMAGSASHPSRFHVEEVIKGAEWRFRCDDGPGGDSDFNDLVFSVRFIPPTRPDPEPIPRKACRDCDCKAWVMQSEIAWMWCGNCGHGYLSHRV
ncbi:MAG TPA: hypothetical protein VGA98_00695 [Allosphingosinicella sp.]|jgi:hypothetical protein